MLVPMRWLSAGAAALVPQISSYRPHLGPPSPGLAEGEAFVSVGQNLLREGSLVRTAEADE